MQKTTPFQKGSNTFSYQFFTIFASQLSQRNPFCCFPNAEIKTLLLGQRHRQSGTQCGGKRKRDVDSESSSGHTFILDHKHDRTLSHPWLCTFNRLCKRTGLSKRTSRTVTISTSVLKWMGSLCSVSAHTL